MSNFTAGEFISDLLQAPDKASAQNILDVVTTSDVSEMPEAGKVVEWFAGDVLMLSASWTSEEVELTRNGVDVVGNPKWRSGTADTDGYTAFGDGYIIYKAEGLNWVAQEVVADTVMSFATGGTTSNPVEGPWYNASVSSVSATLAGHPIPSGTAPLVAADNPALAFAGAMALNVMPASFQEQTITGIPTANLIYGTLVVITGGQNGVNDNTELMFYKLVQPEQVSESVLYPSDYNETTNNKAWLRVL
jgi:hypothetical protein